MPVPHAFDDLADRVGLDANKVWFTTMVLPPDMFEEYITVVERNIATRQKQKKEQEQEQDQEKQKQWQILA